MVSTDAAASAKLIERDMPNVSLKSRTLIKTARETTTGHHETCGKPDTDLQFGQTISPRGCAEVARSRSLDNLDWQFGQFRFFMG
jgi:hypothetical protein